MGLTPNLEGLLNRGEKSYSQNNRRNPREYCVFCWSQEIVREKRGKSGETGELGVSLASHNFLGCTEYPQISSKQEAQTSASSLVFSFSLWGSNRQGSDGSSTEKGNYLTAKASPKPPHLFMDPRVWAGRGVERF